MKSRIDGELKGSQFLQIVRDAPISAIDIIARNSKNEILLGLRRNSPAKNFWFVPGGRILKDESLDEAFARICKNEMGISISRQQAKLLGIFEHHYDDNFKNADFGTHYITQAYEVRVSENTINILDANMQHTEVDWFSEERITGDNKVHKNTKRYFKMPSDNNPTELITLYGIYQNAISSYTNIVWAFPAAFFALNIYAVDLIEKLNDPYFEPLARICFAAFNFLFVQAFFKLVINQNIIVSVTRNLESTLSNTYKKAGTSLLPNFINHYNRFTKIPSAQWFKWGIALYSASFLVYSIYRLVGCK